MSEYRITLWQDGTPIELHTFNLSYEDKGFYRAAVSIEYFSTRESKRLYEANLKGQRDLVGRRCRVRWNDLDYMEINYTQQLPKFSHESVWDFYKAIGYDYKKQKYIENKERA